MKRWTPRYANHCTGLATVVLAALITSGCAREWDIERPVLGTAIAECVESGHTSTLNQPGAFSLGFDSRALWVFEETLLEGSTFGVGVSNTAAWVNTMLGPCDRSFEYLLDGGDLAQLIPFTAEEVAFNATSQDGLYRIKPTAGFVADGTGYVFYDKVLRRGIFDSEHVGSGVATVDASGNGMRPTVGRFVDEPTLLWKSLLQAHATSSFLDTDGFVYIHRAAASGAFRWDVHLARVDVANLLVADAYEFWNGFDWAGDVAHSAALFQGAAEVSVAFNAYDNRYVALYAQPLSNDIVLRTASEPSGPWAVAYPVLTGVAPREFWIRAVRQHPAHATDADQTILISYFSEPVSGPAGVHIVAFDLGEI